MKLNISTEKIRDYKKVGSDALVFGIFEKEKLDKSLNEIDSLFNKDISLMIKEETFNGKFKEFKVIRTHRKISSKLIVLIGLGSKKDFTSEKLRRVSAATAKILRSEKILSATLSILEKDVTEKKTSLEKAQIISEGIKLGLYNFTKYKKKDKKSKELQKIILDSGSLNLSEIKKGIFVGSVLADNVCYVRNLINDSAEVVTPTYLAKEAKKISKVKTKIFGEKALEKMGANCILAVARGSVKEPQMIVMDYGNPKEKPIILVGKGITFDAGGLNLKPTNYIENMNSDMGGGATVIGTMKAISELGIKRRVIGIVPTCENMLGADAYRPSDVLKALNGKTIEIGNTDAEGRLILADALSYAEKNYKAKAIIDIATLTGASLYALGHEIVPLISENTELKNKIFTASKKTDEFTWELPIIDDYKDLMKGDSSDLINVSKERAGPGTITAGIFLTNFVEKTPFAHIDIGASGRRPSDNDYKKKGATGVYLRTFVELIKDF